MRGEGLFDMLQVMPEAIGFVRIIASIKSKIKKLTNRGAPLKLGELRVGGVVPERIATEVAIDPNLLTANESDAVSPEYYLRSSDHAGWAGECVIRFRLENRSDKRVSIRGIHVDKHKLPIDPKGSMLFVPQGRLTGEPYRFACYLDSAGSSSMVLLDSWGCNGRQIIPQNYFDEASIELLPNALLNFAIHLRTEKESFECCGISLVWESKMGKLKDLTVPLPKKVFVYAFDRVPESQRFRRTYDIVAPWITLESDDRFSGKNAYRWY